ncbi:MAG: hypothetical protein ACREUU_03445, partial [Gammaproteobacteria bacterium]
SRLPVPKSIFDTIRNRFNQRNELIHQGKAPDREALKKFLAAVEDLLWMLDYYCGEDWALGYLSNEVRIELGLDPKEEVVDSETLKALTRNL